MIYDTSAFIKSNTPVKKHSTSSFAVTKQLNLSPTKSSNQKNSALEKSIILIGPVGSGKSLIAGELSKQTNMPIISLDSLRFANTKHHLLPNLPNYEQLGYNPKISNYLGEMYGPVAWHMYHKKFEIQLLSEVAKQLKVPCIIDTGGGAPISLEKDYELILGKLKQLEPEIFNDNFDLKQINAEATARPFKQFKNRVYLQLPNNYKSTMGKARNDRLNDAFIGTGQYQDLATQTINVAGLIRGDDANFAVANNLSNTILSNISAKKTPTIQSSSKNVSIYTMLNNK